MGLLFDPPLVLNYVQHHPRPVTYELASLPASERQSFLLIPLSIGLQIFFLAILGPLPRTSTVRKLLPPLLLALLLFLGLQAALYSHHMTSPVINFAYGTASISTTLQGLDLLVYLPWACDSPISKVLTTPSIPPITTSSPFSARLSWAGAVTNNPRMLCTPFEPRVLVNRRHNLSQQSKSQFLIYRLARVILIWILIDALTAYCRWDIYFSSYTHHLAPRYFAWDSISPHLPPALSITRLIRTILGASAVWMSVDGLHSVTALVMVGLAGEPHADWPDMFGFWTEEWYSIADFWTVAWHGLFRQQFTFLTNTTRNAVLRVFIPFTLSAVLHWTGAYMQSRHGSGAVRFFLMQPVAVLGQQLLIGKGGMRGAGRVKKAVVLGSTLLWLGVSAGFFIEEYAKGGMFDIEPAPVSWWSLLGVTEGVGWRWRGTMGHFGW